LFGENDDIEFDGNEELTLNQAKSSVSKAFFEKYNTELVFEETEDDGSRPVTRLEYALMFYPLVQDEADKNVCEYISDIEQTDENFVKISKLYTVGILAGSDRYGNLNGDEIVTASVAKAMISRLKFPEQRVIFAPSVEKSRHVNYFAPVLQNPELPTGCEITSLTSVLNFHGFDVSKTTMADVYLEKGAVGVTDPWISFVGSPYTSSSYGCFSPVIEKCADKFLAENQSSLKTYRLSGVTFRNLFTELEQGNPIIIWASMYLSKTYNSSVWNFEDYSVAWIANEHCLVIYGYDLDRNVVLAADPLVGNTEYDIDAFEERYNELLRQAVVIK
jgi:uncharacterized protein YvpB